MDLMNLSILLGCTFALGGFATTLYGIVMIRERQVSKRVDEFVVEDEYALDEAKIQDMMRRDLSGSFANRVIFPMLKRFVASLGRLTPAQSTRKLDHLLTIARNPYNIKSREFFGISLLFSLIGLVLAITLIVRNPNMQYGLLGLFITILFSRIPYLWLYGQVKKVQSIIRRELPDALDMLSVTATAGLGFDQSLQRVSTYWSSMIGQEFKRVVQEMELGISRAEAMRNLADRVDIPELTGFVAIIIQSEVLGMRIADVLHSQAEQMRVLRQYRAKDVVNQLPAKMMIPLALFILPALLAVILGPVIATFVKAFM